MLKVVDVTMGRLVSDVTADPAASPPTTAGIVEVGMVTAEDGYVVRAAVVESSEVETTAVEGALCVINVVDASNFDVTVVAGIAGTEALCTDPAAADATVEKPEVPGTTGTDDTPP